MGEPVSSVRSPSEGYGIDIMPAEPIPDISAQLAPSKWGDAATYFFFSLGGLFLGGETGFLTGTASASRTITKDPEARERIEQAFKNYRVDVMKQEIQQLEGKSSARSALEKFLG